MGSKGITPSLENWFLGRKFFGLTILLQYQHAHLPRNGWKILLLALIQGISEIFPISSSGHLVVFSRLLHTSISFDLVVFFHIGTFLAILVKYRRQTWGLLSGRFGWKLLSWFPVLPPDHRSGWLGREADCPLPHRLRASQPGAALMDREWSRAGVDRLVFPTGQTHLQGVGWREFILIGLVQGLTAIPGVSRLGMGFLNTGGLLSLVWVEALSPPYPLPVVPADDLLRQRFHLPAGGRWDGLAARRRVRPGQYLRALAGLLLSFASGLVSIRILYKYLSRNLLVFFGLFCLIAGIFFFFFLKLF